MGPATARNAILALAIAAAMAGCGSGSGQRLIRQYEYEEELYLNLDGSATVIVNSSLAALVALRGLDVPADPRARFDRAALRALYESPVTAVTRVSRPWRRAGRRFVQVRVEVSDIRRLGEARPFAWSTYRFGRSGNEVRYRQVAGKTEGRPVADVGWDGSELIAFRMHLPSRINYHDAPSRQVERGNILVWEQTLRERLSGRPVQMEARMESESILYRTLWLFGSAFAAAVALLAGLVWWAMRRGSRDTVIEPSGH